MCVTLITNSTIKVRYLHDNTFDSSSKVNSMTVINKQKKICNAQIIQNKKVYLKKLSGFL